MSSIRLALTRALKQPAFVVALIVLAIFAATLNTAVAFMKVHFTKRPVALRESFSAGIPAVLGHWVMVSKDQAIDPELEQVLATPTYVFRDYVDIRKISDAEINLIKNASVKDREAMLGRLQTEHPSAVIRAAVTYYTGSADTVAHVPERCYVADGYEVKQYEERPAEVGKYADGSPRQLYYRFLGFEDQTGLGLHIERVARNVAYVFHCNGSYESDPYKVRGRLQNLLEPYGYYAKVELMTAAILPEYRYKGVIEANDHEESMLAMENFLTEALPYVEKCLPDWNALHGRGTTSASAK